MSGGHAVVGPMCLEGPASTLVEVVDRALGMTARGDERPRIGLQHPEQVAKVGGVIVAGRFGEPELGAPERGIELADQFLGAVLMITEPSGENASKAIAVSGCSCNAVADLDR